MYLNVLRIRLKIETMHRVAWIIELSFLVHHMAKCLKVTSIKSIETIRNTLYSKITLLYSNESNLTMPLSYDTICEELFTIFLLLC